MTANLTPTSPGQRIELLDTLRGLAIFGILMVNMPLFFSPISSMMVGYTGSDGLLDLFSQLFIKFFFEGKFYVLFSMLFGYGFWLFINRTTEDGKSIIPTFRLRVFFLLLFGIIHVVFLWAGDILVFYALMGFLLILFRKKPNRGLIKWSLWLAFIPTLLIFLVWMMYLLASMNPEAKAGFEAGFESNAAAFQELARKSAISYSTGSFSEIISTRINEYSTLFFGGIFMFYPVVMAMFLLGVWAARKNLIGNFHAHMPFFRKTLYWGIALGIPANLAYAYAYTQTPMGQPNIWGFLGTSMHILGGVLFCLTYVSAIALLSAKGKLNSLRKLIAPVGRMALTNYLMHSIICSIIFLPFGFGLFGKIEIWQGIVLTLMIYALQIPFSAFWLKRFYYGPFEWLWRSLTYRKLQPFVRK